VGKGGKIGDFLLEHAFYDFVDLFEHVGHILSEISVLLIMLELVHQVLYLFLLQ
jgi:hypothetical protein